MSPPGSPSNPVLFQCDQCAFQEWRPEDEEPWLCLVCGYMRWQVVAVAADPDDEEPE